MVTGAHFVFNIFKFRYAKNIKQKRREDLWGNGCPSPNCTYMHNPRVEAAAYIRQEMKLKKASPHRDNLSSYNHFIQETSVLKLLLDCGKKNQLLQKSKVYLTLRNSTKLNMNMKYSIIVDYHGSLARKLSMSR